MANWYLYSIVALLLLGSQRFLNKVAAERHCNSLLTTAVFMGTVTLLSGVAFFSSAATIVNVSSLLVLSLVNSAAFALATIAHIEALKRLPAAITFPLTRLSLVVVIIASVFYFGERLQPLQWVGILLGLVAVAVLAKEASSDVGRAGDVRLGFLFVAGGILCGALASISSKLAVVATDKTGFMALSYLLGTCFSLGMNTLWGKGQKAPNPGGSVIIGVLMGVLNFGGFYAFLVALESGPLSVVALITGMHFVLASVLAVIFYREKISFQRGVGIGMTLLAVFFLKQ